MLVHILMFMLIIVEAALVNGVSLDFQRFLAAEIIDHSVPVGFRHICKSIIRGDLKNIQQILDSDDFWKIRPDSMLVIPEDIATTKLLRLAYLEGRLDICNIILGCPRFTVPISMPDNSSPDLALIVAFRSSGNEQTISELIQQNSITLDTLDKCVGLAQFYQETRYLQIIFHNRKDISYGNLPRLMNWSLILGYKYLLAWLSEYNRYLMYFCLCRDVIGCPDVSSLIYILGRTHEE